MDMVVNGRVVATTNEEPQMTPNERLLKAAKKATVGKIFTVADVKILATEMLELESAVKAYEAAASMPNPDRMTATQQRHRGIMRWSDDKTTVHVENIEFASRDILDAVLGALRGLTNGNKPNELSDSQRRLGLRSTRHMGKDYASPEYD